MKIFVALAAVVAVTVAAPAPTVTSPQLYGIKRTKKSAYGAPCGGGAPLAPIALYLAPQSPQVGPHYREDENTLDEHEHPSARSYYDSGAGLAGAAAASSGGLNLSPPSSSGPAVGLFPNAKVGGCAVPLLLSCAPNVVSGHIVKHSQGYGAPGYGAPAALPAYRDGETKMGEMRETSEQGWSGVERAVHHHESMQSAPGGQGHGHHEHTHNLSHNMNHNSQKVTSL